MARTNSRLQSLLRGSALGWLWNPELLLELFTASNLAVLAGDIVLAHSVNQFRNHAEYIPLFFSAAAPFVIALGLMLRHGFGSKAASRDLGFLVGWLSILVGLAGVLYHLESSYFADRTLRSLTYAAPFAAPLAYTGLGFLLLVNRMTQPGEFEWGRWVVLLATGGFLGNFVLSLTDHATNGFFLKTEWIPVVSSALATGFLVVPVLMPVTRRFLGDCLAVLGLQALVGIVGFVLHMQMNLYAPGPNLFERSVYGAPPMAPLLFPNLVALALLGLWAVAVKTKSDPAAKPGLVDRLLRWAGAEGQASPAES